MNEVIKEMPFEFVMETDGSGFWTATASKVQVTKIELSYEATPEDGDELYGELRVYFDTKTWDTKLNGIIYTDKQFIDDLKGCLEVVGLNDSDIDYNEAGMQGTDYVSFDVGEKFINSWTFKDWAESELAGK